MNRTLSPFDDRNKGRLPEDVAEVIAWTCAKEFRGKPSQFMVGTSNYVCAEYYTHLRKETVSMKRMIAATVRGDFSI
jgi:hypothetical protein